MGFGNAIWLGLFMELGGGVVAQSSGRFSKTFCLTNLYKKVKNLSILRCIEVTEMCFIPGKHLT